MSIAISPNGLVVSPEINLSKKQTIAWDYLEDKTTNEVMFGGSAGGGKSYLGCIWHIHRRMTYPNSRGLIGRSTISSLEQSTLITLFKVADLMGYVNGYHYIYNSQKHIITWCSGSVTILKDLSHQPSDPDYTRLGSLEITDCYLEEVSEISLRALEIIKSRIRWKLNDYGIVAKCLLTSNPSDNWLKERYIEKNGQPVILPPHMKFVQSLVEDNPDKEFVKNYVENLTMMSSDYDQRRLLYGDWSAIRDNENPFAYQWSDSKHISDVAVYDYSKQLIISLDFNLIPFACTFRHYWQDSSGVHYHVFDELSIAQGNIPEMIDRIKNRYSASLPSCILTGDNMGSRGEISQRDNASIYKQIMRGLGLRDSQLKISGNPKHKNSRSDVNYVLRHFPDYKVSPTCTGLIRDMRNVQVDAQNSIIKGSRKDLNQRADMLDTERYAIDNILYKWLEYHQKQNRLV